MNLIIYFKKIGEIEIRLTKAGKLTPPLKRTKGIAGGKSVSRAGLIDTLDFSFQGNLDDLLISSVDKVLKKNRIETLSLKTVKVLGNIEKSSSAYKIAQTFVKAIKASKQADIAGS